MSTCTERDGTFHTHDTTVWFRLAYGTRLPLWRFIPHRWVTRRCPTEEQITALAKALFDVGLTSIGPDDIDNRQIATRLLHGGHVQPPR